jgi:hypothetical protein
MVAGGDGGDRTDGSDRAGGAGGGRRGWGLAGEMRRAGGGIIRGCGLRRD